jgi:hypothetical protein
MADCNDQNDCTIDDCVDNQCQYNPVDPWEVCPDLDVVFIMDTSGSMGDEAATLCNGINQLITDLGVQHGVVLHPTILGITEHGQPAGDGFSCLTDDVSHLLGHSVSGDLGGCDNNVNHSGGWPDGSKENWGGATSIVAERFAWGIDHLRLVIPISDEGPFQGDPCDQTCDTHSITNAIYWATNGSYAPVAVYPIAASGSNSCVMEHMGNLAIGTGGEAFQSDEGGLLQSILNAVDDACDKHCYPSFLNATVGDYSDLAIGDWNSLIPESEETVE